MAKGAKETSKHLDSDRKETKASGEKKHGSGTLMDGIVGGLPRRVNPPVVDGIVRGCGKNVNPGLSADMSRVQSSATKLDQGNFGSGVYAQGK